MTDLACAELEEYTYAEHRRRFEKWLCSNKRLNKFKSQYKEVWEGTNTSAERRFDFAAWAAAHAARRGTGIQLTDDEAYEILEQTGFDGLAKYGVKWLPDPDDFDTEHHDWCNEVRKEVRKVAKRRGGENWKHGKAAKLINIFLKALMPADLEDAGFTAEEKAKWYAVHPPIDGMVLDGMKKAGIGDQNFWKSLPGSAPHGSFNQFEYEDYQNVIDLIRKNLRECGEKDPLPLWKNERFFKP